MKDQNTTTESNVWINPYTGREMGATLDDIIRDIKAKQEAEKKVK